MVSPARESVRRPFANSSASPPQARRIHRIPHAFLSLPEGFDRINIKVSGSVKKTAMSISITKVEGFSGKSFDFEEPVGNRFGSESIGLVAEDGGPLLLLLKDCLAYGINKDKKFGKENFTIPLAVGNNKDFISALEVLERRCAEETGKSGTNVIRCFYRGGNQPVLYAKIDETTVMHKDGGGDIDPMKPTSKHFYLDALVRFPSIYVSKDTVSVQVKLQEAKYLRVKVAEPW